MRPWFAWAAVVCSPVVLLGCGGGASGTTADCRPAPQTPSVEAESSTYTFALDRIDGQAIGRVERTRFADGSEQLRGDTEIRPGDAPGHWLAEVVTLDSSGRLRDAELRLDSAGPERRPLRRLTLLPAQSTVRVEREDGVSSRTVSGNEPWIYVAPFGADSSTLVSATPIAAWVAVRARAFPAGLRMIGSQSGEDAMVMADQVVIEDGSQLWVVLGDQVARADEDFVRTFPAWQPARKSPASAVAGRPGPFLDSERVARAGRL